MAERTTTGFMTNCSDCGCEVPFTEEDRAVWQGIQGTESTKLMSTQEFMNEMIKINTGFCRAPADLGLCVPCAREYE